MYRAERKINKQNNISPFFIRRKTFFECYKNAEVVIL